MQNINHQVKLIKFERSTATPTAVADLFVSSLEQIFHLSALPEDCIFSLISCAIQPKKDACM